MILKKRYFVIGGVLFLILLTAPSVMAGWWDTATYGYAYEIHSTAEVAGMPISVNDTDGVGATNIIIWTNNETSDQQWLVSTGGNVTGTLAVGNSTNQAFWEYEATLLGNSPESVWGADYEFVLHSHNTSMNDSTVNNVIFTKVGDPAQTTGVFGNAVVYDGTDDRYTYPALGAVFDDDYTIELWFYATTRTDSGILSTRGDKNSYIRYDQAGNGLVTWRYYESASGKNIDCAGIVTLDKWNYFVVVANNSAGEVHVYLNNTLCGSDLSYAEDDATTENTLAGYDDSYPEEFFGRIDEARILSRAISEAEIDANWKNGQNTLMTLGAEEEEKIFHDSETLLFLNDTQANATYEVGEYANFSTITNITGITIYMDSDYTGWETQSGTTSYENLTYLSTIGTDFNITGYIEGNSSVNPSNQTYFFNVTIPTVPTVAAADFGIIITFITDRFKTILVR